MLIYKLIATILLFNISLTATANTNIEDPVYTEDLQTFQKVNKRGRMQILLGCWFMARQYNHNKNITSKFYSLALIKKCMQKITRKDSVIKITSIVGKNLDKPKNYEDIIKSEEIPVFDQVLHPTNQYQVIEMEKKVGQFDKMILSYINSYQKDLEGVSKEGQSAQLKKRLDDEINKRQKYYFGIIPANKFTSMLGLIAIAVFLVVLCTCWKRYQLRNNNEKQGKEQNISSSGYRKLSSQKKRN